MTQENSTPLAVKKAAPQSATYRRLRKIGLLLSAISGAVLALPVTLPPVVVTLVTLSGSLGGLLVSIARILMEPSGKGEPVTRVSAAVSRSGPKEDVDKNLFRKRRFAKFFS